MGKLLKLAIIVIVVWAILPAAAQSINFGTLLKDNQVKITPGSTADFTILVWTLIEEEYPVMFTIKEVPKDWKVIINPTGDFVLNQDPEEPTEIMLLGNENVKAKVIKVYVKTPSGAADGEYKVKISALAGFGESNIVVRQERPFTLTVDVDAKADADKTTGADMNDAAPFYDEITGAVANMIPNSSGLLTYVILIVILILAWIIYKHE